MAAKKIFTSFSYLAVEADSGGTSLTGRRVSRGPQGHRFHPLVRPPQAVATSVAHSPTRSHDRLRSGELLIELPQAATTAGRFISATVVITSVQICCNIHQLPYHVNLSIADKCPPARRVISGTVQAQLSVRSHVPLPLDLACTLPLALHPVSAVEIKGKGIGL